MTERKPGDYQEYASAHEHDIVLNEHRKDEILGGRYRVLSLLGRGGMGVVYRVEQIFLGKELALKTIDQTAQSDIAIRRFQAEARAVFAVNHPNIVAVHDFGLLDEFNLQDHRCVHACIAVVFQKIELVWHSSILNHFHSF